MKNIFKVLLVGLLFIGLSSVAGAEEWKKMELPAGVMLELQIPEGFATMEVDKEATGSFGSIFMNEQTKTMIIVKKGTDFLDSDFPEELRKKMTGKYPFDSLTSDEEQQFLKKVLKQGETYQFVTLPNGHRAMRGFDGQGRLQAYLMIQMVDQYVVGVAVVKEGEFTEAETKMTDEIFKRTKS